MVLIISVSNRLNNVLLIKAKNNEYSIILDKDNAIYTSGLRIQKTHQRKSDISFSYTNVETYLEGHTKLNSGGSIKNTSQITSISSVCATFSTEGSLYFRISYDSLNWSNITRLSSEETLDLYSEPYFIEFLTDNENYVDIDSIILNFTCIANPNANSGVPQMWGAIDNSYVDLNNVSISTNPFGLKLSYYNDIYSRGFAWTTDQTVNDSKLYVIEGSGGLNADFSASYEIDGTSVASGGVNLHKAFIENLNLSTTYSYKVGSSSGWAYGTFTTDSSKPDSLTAIHISDAQTKNPNLLNVWENTFAQAVETAGRSLDMVLYNGDQYQKNSSSPNNDQVDYSAAIETITPYLGSTPYMSVAGNHDYYTYTENTCVDFTNNLGGSDNDMYYSYDYGKVHFITLNTNRVPGLGRRNSTNYSFVEIGGTSFNVESTLVDQATWLINDLKTAHQNGAKWIVVTMHLGPHSTGDHSSEDQAMLVNASFTPIFSAYHVDLVLQAHDHTYAKTLPYKWDTAGHTEISHDSAIVNLKPVTTVLNGESYDLNPYGTYYVTTGAAGHRVGAEESDSGIFADINHSTGQPVVTEYTSGKPNAFTYNTYKTEVGYLTESNSYVPYDAYLSYGTVHNYHSDQIFNVGAPAAGNVNANMFGVLNIKNSTLTYDIYTVRGNEVCLFDTLNVMKNFDADSFNSPEDFIDEVNNWLAFNDLLEMNTIRDVFSTFLNNGVDLSNLDTHVLNTYYFWDQDDNRFLYARRENNDYIGIYPLDYYGERQSNHHWFSLSGQINQTSYLNDINGDDIVITGNAIEAGEKLYKLSEDIKLGSFDLNTNVEKVITLPEDVDFAGAEFCLGTVSNLTIQGQDENKKAELENIVNTSIGSISSLGNNRTYCAGLIEQVNGDVAFKNLKIKNAMIGDYSISMTSLFAGRIDSGTLTIENCEIEDITIYGEQKVSTFVAYINRGNVVIKNCTVKNVHIYAEEGCAGGIFGYKTQSSYNSANIVKCDSTSALSIRSNVSCELTKVADRQYYVVSLSDLPFDFSDASREVVTTFSSYFNRTQEIKNGKIRCKPGCATYGWIATNDLYPIGQAYMVSYGMNPMHAEQML